jgi:hypothetical protein
MVHQLYVAFWKVRKQAGIELKPKILKEVTPYINIIQKITVASSKQKTANS